MPASDDLIRIEDVTAVCPTCGAANERALAARVNKLGVRLLTHCDECGLPLLLAAAVTVFVKTTKPERRSRRQHDA